MVRAYDHAHHVRRNEPDESDRAADRHAYADQARYRDQYDKPNAAHVHPDLPRVVFPDGKSIEFPRMQQQHRAANQKRRRKHRGAAIACALQAAHRPERDALDMFGRKRDDDAHNARRKHRKDHADQNDRVGRKRAVKTVGKPQYDQQRQKREQDRHHHRPGKGQFGERDPERDRNHRAE